MPRPRKVCASGPYTGGRVPDVGARRHREVVVEPYHTVLRAAVLVFGASGRLLVTIGGLQGFPASTSGRALHPADASRSQPAADSPCRPPPAPATHTGWYCGEEIRQTTSFSVAKMSIVFSLAPGAHWHRVLVGAWGSLAPGPLSAPGDFSRGARSHNGCEPLATSIVTAGGYALSGLTSVSGSVSGATL